MRRLYSFGPYLLDASERVLLREGQPVAMPPKDLETLLVLVERAGHIVEKDELLGKVWPGVFVEEGNLARHIFSLRQVLGDRLDGVKYIETIPKRGYRFVATVQVEHPNPDAIPIPAANFLQPAQASVPDSPKKSRRWYALAALFAVLLVTAVVIAKRFKPTSQPAQQRAMLAVLPFENLSGDPGEDYFADGLTEEMIAQLGQLQPARLGVIARTSTVRYKHTKESIAQIGQELGVGYLLEGSVRRGGDRVRVTAQLIQAGEQTHLWAETYERPLTDVLTIQREIAEKITNSLSIQLLPGAVASAAGAPVNFESYDQYLLGLHELEKGTRESGDKAIQHFQKAILTNPQDARLYAVLGEAYDKMTTYYGSPAETMPQAKAAALKALELDGNLASAHVLLGDVRLLFDWDWAAADSEYRRALELNPSLPEAQLGYATYLATLGHFDEALSRVQRAYLTDPLAVDSRNAALWIYYFSGRMPETIEQCQKAIELEPTAGLPHAILANAYAQLGQAPETLSAAEDAIRLSKSPSLIATTASALARVGQRAKAKQLLDKALQLSKDHYICRFIVASTYADLGETESALDSLQQGFLQRST